MESPFPVQGVCYVDDQGRGYKLYRGPKSTRVFGEDRDAAHRAQYGIDILAEREAQRFLTEQKLRADPAAVAVVKYSPQRYDPEPSPPTAHQ